MVKYRSDPSTSTAKAVFAQDDCSWEVHCSVEALAEIFDFVAGLVQRVPKKTSIAKDDLQNSTARLWNLDFRYGDEYDGEIVVRLRLREDNVV